MGGMGSVGRTEWWGLGYTLGHQWPQDDDHGIGMVAFGTERNDKTWTSVWEDKVTQQINQEKRRRKIEDLKLLFKHRSTYLISPAFAFGVLEWRHYFVFILLACYRLEVGLASELALLGLMNSLSTSIWSLNYTCILFHGWTDRV